MLMYLRIFKGNQKKLTPIDKQENARIGIILFF